MDTNLVFLTITIILFIAILIFDFAFFRFRERKFEEDEPFNFLVQTTWRSLQAWFKAMQQPEAGEPSFGEEGEEFEAGADALATARKGAEVQRLDKEIPVAERPPVRVKITADVPEGTVVHITMQVTDAQGKVSTQDSTTLTGKPSAQIRRPVGTSQLKTNKWFAERINQLKGIKLNTKWSLSLALFWGAIISYAIIISFGIDKWPIYFFTDEAIHMNMIAYFLNHGFQNYDGEFLPTFFIKQGWVNGTSVYLQLLPYLIFGKSVIVTRLVSAVMTLLGAIAVCLLLKNVFRTKYYWVGLFLLLTTPAWFLHARTAFEYAEVASFYCMFLYFYGRYRKGHLRSLYLAILAAALCFYTHGLGQVLTGVTGLALFIIDFRYHIHPERRRTILIGLGLALILLIPYVRYYLSYPTEIAEQIKRRNSYWSNPTLSTPDKILEFLNEYFYGLNPLYWYVPNNVDIDRHIMLGFGNGLLVTLPFMIVGFFRIFRTIRNLAKRVGIIALMTVCPILISWFTHAFTLEGNWTPNPILILWPFSASEAIFTLSSSPFAAIPVETVMNSLWVALALMLIGVFLAFIEIRNPIHKLALVALLACPIPASLVAIGMPRMLWMSVPLAILTAIGLSTVMRWIENRAKIKSTYSSLALFAILLLSSLLILRSALVDGPLWFQDYGLYGMQYGGQQVFEEKVLPELENDPNISFVISPSWANGTEEFTDFFIPANLQPRVHMGQPIDFIENADVFTNTRFVATAAEFSNILRDEKFVDVNVIDTILYPNKQVGFYIATMRLADNIGEILAEQHAAARNPIEDTMTFNGEEIRVIHSPLGMGSLDMVFDNNPDSLVRVEEANPFFIALYPNTPIDTHSVFIKTGSLHNYTITIRLYAPGAAEPVEYINTYQDEPDKPLPPDPEVTIEFDRGPDKAERIEIEVKDNLSGETSSIHLRTIQFK